MHHAIKKTDFTKDDFDVKEEDFAPEEGRKNVKESKEKQESKTVASPTYQIPKGSEISKSLIGLFEKFDQMIVEEIKKPEVDFEKINKALGSLDTVRRVYTSLALFNEIKYRITE